MTDVQYIGTDERERRKESWPSRVRPISIDEMDLIGLDPDGILYWDGKAIEVRKSLSLSFWQKVGAGLTVASAVIAAIATVVSTVIDLWAAFAG